MKFIRLILFAFLAAVTLAAQQPQTLVDPVNLLNAKYTNGVAPGYWATAGSGLTLNISAGTANCQSTMTAYAGGTLTMTASTTNYVYLDGSNSCAVSVKTTAFQSDDVPIALVVTGSSTITSVTDYRTPMKADTPVVVVHTSGSPYSMHSLTGFYWNNTSSTYSWTLDTPDPGIQYCFGNYAGKTGALTITTTKSVYIVFEGVAGTVTTGTLTSSGAAGDFICLVAVDSTHYNAIGAGYGTWTNH